MGNAKFRMVAATDGAPASPSGNCYYLLAHAVATALLLITLVAAVWQFMDWLGAPSDCLGNGPQPSTSSSPPRSYQYVARAEKERSSDECPCPQER
jgi:hypothetical protein